MIPANEIAARISSMCDRVRGEAAAALSDLVRLQSTSGNEASAQAWIEQRLRSLDLEPDVWVPDLAECQAHSAYSDISRRDTAGRPNVVARWRGAGNGRSLILNGHVDVVGTGARDRWTRDPWDGALEAGYIHGRGSVDMKAGLVAEIYALAVLRLAGLRPRGDVIVESVIGEEEGGVGTLATLLRGYRADAALVAEPTGLTLAPSAAGISLFKVLVEGRAAHGSRRTLGVSAFEKFLPIHAALRGLEAELNAEVGDPLFLRFELPLSLNFHHIEAVGQGSSVADVLVAEGRFGFLGRAAVARSRFETAVAGAAERDDWLRDHPPRVEWLPGAWEPVPLAPPELIGTFQRSFRRARGRETDLVPKVAGTDARLLTQVGGIPTIVFGPGDFALAHFPDERVPTEQLFQAISVIAHFVVEWCGLVASE